MISFIVEDGEGTRRIELPSLPITIGRSSEAALPLRDEQCSRQHARIESGRHGFELRDLGSANGTFKNGERVRRAVIERGDRITIGSVQITFLGGDAVTAEREPPPAIPGLLLEDTLGHGVLSEVCRARQEALDRDVAVKVLRPEWRGDLEVSTHFQRLARRQARIQTRGLASGIDVGETGSVPWFVVELLEGETLEARVRRAMIPEPAEAVRILRGVLEVVRAVHAQGSTLDHLHAGSVIVTPDHRVVVTSLGFPLPRPARYPVEFAAELACLPPEAVRDPEKAGVRGDLYQVGALAAFLLSGRPVRPVGDVPATLEAVASGEPARFEPRRGVPDELRAWIQRLLAPEPADRPGDADTALAELDGLAGRMEGVAARVAAVATELDDRPSQAPAPRDVRRFKLISWSVFGLIFVGANLGLYFGLTGFFDARRQEKQAEADRLLEERRAKALEEARQRGLGRPATGPAPTAANEAEARSAYEALETRLPSMLEGERFDEALDALESFEKQWRGTRARGDALERRAAVLQALVRAKDRAVATVEAALAKQDADLAAAGMARVRALARRIDPTEVASLEARIAALRKPAAGSGDEPVADEASGGGTEASPGVGAPSPGALAARIEKALARPAAVAERRALLELAPRYGDVARVRLPLRRLAALDRSLRDLAAALQGRVGETLRVVRGTEALEGRLRSATPEAWVLEIGGAEVALSLDAVAPATLAAELATLEPTLDHYLARAWFHRRGEDRDEAWFDLQAALVLAADDDAAREQAEAWLAELRERAGH